MVNPIEMNYDRERLKYYASHAYKSLLVQFRFVSPRFFLVSPPFSSSIPLNIRNEEDM